MKKSLSTLLPAVLLLMSPETISYVHRFGMLIQGLLARGGQFPTQLPSVPLDGRRDFTTRRFSREAVAPFQWQR